ncbi:PA1571 family protein [Acinetobacter sp. NCu2D-2]|uniref:PA1571 family protein n=1 Tax=Acinetobacter sp. NCu2D-2 TaxID=1608473 RepID=UPI000A8B4361|nr:PA1571 family protein [Acinetobacter sp. NCu2D-2]
MSMSKAVINQGIKHVLEAKTVHAGYIVDERGNEVQITSSMVRHVCHQLLKQCRTVKA